MKIVMNVKNINYSELVTAYWPQIKELSDDAIIKAISYVPAGLAGSVVKHIPQKVLDSLTVNIVEKRKDSIMNSIEQLAEKKGFHIELSDISIETDTEE